MASVADYISKNISRIRHDMRLGLISLSVMQNYDIYNLYVSISESEPIKEKRYRIVGSRYKCSKSTVKKAIYEMEKSAT